MNVYIQQGSLICDTCGDGLRRAILADSGIPDDLPQGPYTNGGGEADMPNHCDNCGVFLGNPLTTEGLRWTTERVAEGGGAHINEWADFYEIKIEQGDE